VSNEKPSGIADAGFYRPDAISVARNNVKVLKGVKTKLQTHLTDKMQANGNRSYAFL